MHPASSPAGRWIVRVFVICVLCVPVFVSCAYMPSDMQDYLKRKAFKVAAGAAIDSSTSSRPAPQYTPPPPAEDSSTQAVSSGAATGTRKVAVFPSLARYYSAEDRTSAVRAAAKGLSESTSSVIAFSIMPEETGGMSLAADAAVLNNTWEGSYSKSLNQKFLLEKGKELEVQGILVLEINGGQRGGQNQITGYLFDVNKNQMLEEAITFPTNEGLNDQKSSELATNLGRKWSAD